MTPKEIESYIVENFKGVVPKSSWGETSFFYNPNKVLPNGVYFCTIKEQNGENDKASLLSSFYTAYFNSAGDNIAETAELSRKYGIEIRKGIRLSKYVKLI